MTAVPATVETRATIFRTTIAGTLGTTLEYYDYVIYGLATALVFNRLFYSDLPPEIGFIAGFATYAVGFGVRPIGGLLLGAVGDRVGRKFIMVLTILLMGVSTFAIGLLPTYAQVGILAPLLLVVCRMVQGFAAGAELASASSLMVETAPVRHRGFVGSFVSFGTNGGSLLASSVWILVALMPEEQFLSWGWRLPFLASVFITFIGLWVRRHVKESNVFESVVERQRSTPMSHLYRNLLKSGWRTFLRAFGMRVGEGGTSVIYQVFLIGYVTQLPGAIPSAGATALAVSALFGIVSIPLLGMLSDKIGRRTTFLILSGGQLLFAFPGLLLINTGQMWAIILAFILGSAILVQGMYATESAYFVEMFGMRHRLTGVTASKEIGGMVGAGFAPLIAAALLAAVGHWWVIALYVAFLSAIAFVSALAAPETRGRDLTLDEDVVAPRR
jgi:MFS transporter, MHS family, metabolite:H+ symporter